MDKVSLRDFQLKPTNYLDKLPIVLTRYGKEIAVVSNFQNSPPDNVGQNYPPNPRTLTFTTPEFHRCEYPGCKTPAAEEFEISEYNWDTGSSEGKAWLCAKHAKLKEANHG